VKILAFTLLKGFVAQSDMNSWFNSIMFQ